MKRWGGRSSPWVLLAAAAVLAAVGCEIVPVRETRGPAGPQTVPAETPEEVAAEAEETVLAPGAPTDTEIRAMQVFRSAGGAVINVSPAGGGTPAAELAQPVSGSGTIVAPEGLVITSRRTAEAGPALTVTLQDGTSFEAELLGTDPDTDLALLSFDPRDAALTAATLGSPDKLFVGQMAIALGNPLGRGCTLSVGTVSGLDRPVRMESGYVTRFLQTDAAIHRGNAGGPLLEPGGEVIGVSVLPPGAPEGVSVAVPADTVKRVLADLQRDGEVRRGWIDLTVRPVDPVLARRAGLPVSRGLLVVTVPPGGPADLAGLRGGEPGAGDIIVGIDGRPVRGLLDYLEALEATRPDQTVTLAVRRGDQTLSLSVELSRRPATYPW